MNVLRPIYQRSILFFTAIVLRLFLGYVFFGGVDTKCYIDMARLVVTHQWLSPQMIWNIFPTCCLPLWLSSLICVKTGWPVAFCVKLMPICFDALIAVLIYDIVRKYRPDGALRAGMIYALSPVGMLVASIHGQWDAVVIFLLMLSFYIREFYADSLSKYFLFGVLFALSFLLKTYTLVFMVFFFSPLYDVKRDLGKIYTFLKWVLFTLALVLVSFFVMFKCQKTLTIQQFLLSIVNACNTQIFLLVMGLFSLLGLYLFYTFYKTASIRCKNYITYQAVALLGLGITVSFCFSLFSFYGFNLFTLVDTVLRYGNQAAPSLGFPLAPMVKQSWLFCLLKNRFWLLLPISVFAFYYHMGKITVFQGIGMSFALILGLSGLVANYYMWLFPFLLILGLYTCASMYNIAVTTFFVFYYANPLANEKFPYKSILSFVSLKNFSWLMPSQFFTQESWVHLLRAFNHYIIPCTCLVSAGYAMYIYLFKQTKAESSRMEQGSPYKNGYVLILASLLLTMVFLTMLFNASDFALQFEQFISDMYQQYAVTTFQTHIVGAFPACSYGNISIVLLGLGTICSFLLVKTFKCYHLRKNVKGAL